MRHVVLLFVVLALGAPGLCRARDVAFPGASANFEFVAHLHGDCDPSRDADPCIGPATLDVRRHGASRPFQTVALEALELELDDGGAPRINDGQLYGAQGMLNVGDFNFDRHEDFAVRTGDDGPYGGPTFEVFLYAPVRGRFESNGALTSLIGDTLGFFGVDAKRRRLIAQAKSGCCFHVRSEYAMVNDEPVETSRLTEDALGGGEWTTITREWWIHGRHHQTSRRVRTSDYYKD